MTFLSVVLNAGLTFRDRIVHRLPGRLRLMIPEMAFLPAGYDAYVATARELLMRLPGIHEVSPSLATKTVLFRYDPAIVTESLLIAWIEMLIKDGIRRFAEQNGQESKQMKLEKLFADSSVSVEKIKAEHAAAQENRTHSEIEDTACH